MYHPIAGLNRCWYSRGCPAELIVSCSISLYAEFRCVLKYPVYRCRSLCPDVPRVPVQVLYSRGSLVELLVSSSIARYAEFPVS